MQRPAEGRPEPAGPAKGKAPGTPARPVSTDQFSQKTINLVLKQMKKAEQGERAFQPGRMMHAGGAGKAASTPAVMTEELRAEMRQVSQASKTSDLTEFEKVFLEYFIGNRTLGALLAAGEKKYRQKKLEEWRGFFEQLYAYIQEKKTSTEKIREFVFRGISNQDPRPSLKQGQARPPVLVADLYLKRERRDRCEKFVRLDIPTNNALNEMRQLSPGSTISVETFEKHFGDGEISYLCLYYRPVRQGLMVAEGHPLAKSMARQAGVAKQAREAMFSKGLDVSSKSADLAKRQMKEGEKLKDEKEGGTEHDFYKQKNLLDKLLG